MYPQAVLYTSIHCIVHICTLYCMYPVHCIIHTSVHFSVLKLGCCCRELFHANHLRITLPHSHANTSHDFIVTRTGVVPCIVVPWCCLVVCVRIYPVMSSTFCAMNRFRHITVCAYVHTAVTVWCVYTAAS